MTPSFLGTRQKEKSKLEELDLRIERYKWVDEIIGGSYRNINKNKKDKDNQLPLWENWADGNRKEDSRLVRHQAGF